MRRRLGFSLPELLAVITVMGVIAAMVMPTISELRTRSGLRSARIELLSALAAARSASMQKAKPATVRMTGSSIVVSVVSGIRNDNLQIYGPLRLDRTSGATLRPLSGAPTSIVFDARGLISPTTTAVTRYELRMGTMADTVCLTGSGAPMPKGCAL